MSRALITSLLLIFVFSVTEVFPQEAWVGKDSGIRSHEARALSAGGGILFVATKNEVYRSMDERGKWDAVFSLPSGENEINCLDVQDRRIFIGTKRGLYRSLDGGKSWNNVFKTFIPEKSNVLCIAQASDGKAVIGTEKGIFFTEDSGKRWKDISGSLDERAIKCLAFSKDDIYAGGDGGIYLRKSSTGAWERIFIDNLSDKFSAGEEAAEAAGEESGEEGSIAVNCIAIRGGRIYAGMDKKVLYSDDGGNTWQYFEMPGISGYITSILPSKKTDTIYAGTTKGAFEFSREKSSWVELYKGMDRAVGVNNLAFDNAGEGRLWAVTSDGVYRLEGGRYAADQYIDIERGMKALKIVFDNEPSFKELRQAALKYAELDPDKITKWRREARLAALLPKVSFGVDNNSSTTAEIYTSATKDYVITGPDDITNGWDVSVSWELGNIIWGDDQTNIDVRSRLTTQLRNDILDDLRRLYYERKRLQYELMADPPKDMKLRFEKEMRVEELTQGIDDLTGNYLSGHIRKE